MTPVPLATIVASAPGKLMLLGEYAVLDGAPALVAAVDRRARVRIRRLPGPRSRINAPHLGLRAEVERHSDGGMTWVPADAPAGRLRLVATVLQEAAADGAGPAIDAVLSTDDFFDRDRRAKIGFGSSAALTVALAGALRRLAGLARPDLAGLVRLHRAVQDGRGSGADIAASLTGGLIAYTPAGPSPAVPAPAAPARTRAPAVLPLAVPDDLHWCCVWTGRSTSTGDFLRRLDDWRRDRPADYAARLAGLTALAEAGAAALRGGDTATFLDTVAGYADALDGLGRASDIGIVGDEHRHIGEPASRYGVIYKTSGAGGGDIGIALSTDPDRLAAFRRQVEPEFRTVDVAVDPQGLAVIEDDGTGGDPDDGTTTALTRN